MGKYQRMSREHFTYILTELDGLEKVTLLGVVGVRKELLDVGTNAGNRDFRHLGWCLPRDECFLWWLCCISG